MSDCAYRRPVRRGLALVGLMLVLAACAQARPETGALIASHDPAPDASLHTIHIATTRAPNAEAGTLFSGERGAQTGFARVAVSVPAAHEPGEIEWPRRPPGDPAKHFVTRDGGVLSGEAEFTAGLKAALAARPTGDRDVLVFVHGYNTLFAEGVYRYVQIVNDSGFAGVPVLFTWASRGRVVDYVYDRDSATAARDALERTLEVAAASGATRVHILAHSMGNWLTVEALRQARIAGNRDFGGRLGEVVLASPDIDVDVFKTQMRRLGRPERPFNVLVSKDDRALQMAGRIGGGKPRVGAYENDAELAALGVNVIDLTRIDSGDKLNHAKFAQAPEIVRLLGGRLREGDRLAVKERPDLGRSLENFGRSLGGVVGATADVIVTTPAAVLSGGG